MDLYVALGLGRGASAGEIRRAYRRLARRYHPEVNPGDDEAEALFRRIVEAYETLSHPDRRRAYDSGVSLETPRPAPEEVPAFAFEGFDFSARVQGEAASTFGDLFADVVRAAAASVSDQDRGADLHAELRIPFAAVVDGVTARFAVTRRGRCGGCGGDGRLEAPGVPCGECGGTGTVRTARGHMVFRKACARCEGTGAASFVPCPACGGAGVAMRTESLAVHVPPGVQDGERLRLAGEGNAGARGAAPGDLYVTVHVEPDPRFRRDGDDVHIDVPLAIHEAAFGARLEVPSPTGTCRLRVPPGTQSGQQFRVREQGLPSPRTGRTGDLVATVRVVLPPMNDEHTRTLIRSLAGSYPGDVRARLG
jgi:molecular chaperone DnaJ